MKELSRTVIDQLKEFTPDFILRLLGVNIGESFQEIIQNPNMVGDADDTTMTIVEIRESHKFTFVLPRDIQWYFNKFNPRTFSWASLDLAEVMTSENVTKFCNNFVEQVHALPLGYRTSLKELKSMLNQALIQTLSSSVKVSDAALGRLAARVAQDLTHEFTSVKIEKGKLPFDQK